MPRRKVARKSSRTKSRGKAKKKSEHEHTLERGLEQFGEEIGRLGEKFGSKMEKGGGEWDSWFHRTFGLVGPLISSVFGLLILGLGIWALNFVNLGVGSGFLFNLSYFLLANIAWFFLIFLFFSYTSYFSKANPRAYMPVSPVVIAAGITIAFWIATNAIMIANISLGISALSNIVFLIERNLLLLFWIFLFLGYIVLLVKVSAKKPLFKAEGRVREKSIGSSRKPVKMAVKPQFSEVRRIYRSGKDRILGGVCGGIAEYLDVDPVIIRLLWIIATLAWGFGILLYIILWIIIPRNPNHKWGD